MFCLCGTEETYKMVRMNARLIPTTEKSGLATPLWSDSEFKTLLGEQMDLIVTEKVRQKLTQKYEIHPDKTWSVDECKKVLGASIRKNNVKGIICCYREFSVTLATQQSQRNSELEKQNNELRARISTLTKKLNLKKEAKTDVEVSQPDSIYPDLQAFSETDVALQSVTDVPVNSVNVEETDSVPPNSSVVQIQTVANALCPKDIERLSQSLTAARTHLTEFRRTLISRWVEAYPTRRATAAHTAKCLVTDFIPRWGLPDCIDSDQGTHFTGQVVKEVSRMLKIKWNLHCPYRPQASGQVERSNRTIKTRLSKMHQEGVPWVEALPAELCSMRASSNRSVGLSPHEIITGRPMQMPGVIDLRNADVHIASDALIAYCENLTKAVQSAKERVESCWQTPPEGGHTIVPGQWVMIKAFKNKPLEPKWYGPHQVMLITAAAVLCQGRKTWTHVSHCKVVPPPAGIG